MRLYRLSGGTWTRVRTHKRYRTRDVRSMRLMYTKHWGRTSEESHDSRQESNKNGRLGVGVDRLRCEMSQEVVSGMVTCQLGLPVLAEVRPVIPGASSTIPSQSPQPQAFGLPLNASKFTVPSGTPLKTSTSANSWIREQRCSPPTPSSAAKYAPSPQTCAAAMDVPEMVC